MFTPVICKIAVPCCSLCYSQIRFALMEFDGAWHLQSFRLVLYHGKAIIKFRTCGYQAWPCTPQGDIDNE